MINSLNNLKKQLKDVKNKVVELIKFFFSSLDYFSYFLITYYFLTIIINKEILLNDCFSSFPFIQFILSLIHFTLKYLLVLDVYHLSYLYTGLFLKFIRKLKIMIFFSPEIGYLILIILLFHFYNKFRKF